MPCLRISVKLCDQDPPSLPPSLSPSLHPSLLPPSLPPSLPAVQACKWHNGSESFGQRWKKGDIVGCLLDFNEKTMCEWQLQFVSNA